MEMIPWKEIFVASLGASLGCQLWLVWRQARHVQAYRHAVPGPFVESVTLAQHQTAARYTVARTRLRGVGLGVGACMTWLWTLGGGIDTLDRTWRTWLPDASSRAQGTWVVLTFLSLSAFVSLPQSAVRTFWLEARFGFNKTTVALFCSDLVKSIVLTGVIVAPLCYAVLWLLERAGPGGWWMAWGLWTALTFALVWIFPVWIAPLFNKFRPLEDATLLERVRALLTRCGFLAEGIFVMDGSKRSGHGNAYFTGFGKSKRVVFFDTLIATLSPLEIEGVLAHELGHFKLHHIRNRLILSTVSSLGGFYVLGALLNEPTFFAALGVTQPSAHTALLLFALAAPVATFWFTPLSSWYARRHEYAADAYASAHSDGAALARALTKLYRDNASTLTPDPLHSAFYDSHPSALDRIERLG